MTMLMRTDPFHELDRLTQQVFGAAARPAAMPVDAYRKDDWFYLHFDLPGVKPDDIELTVERNVLTVRAQRRGATQDAEDIDLVASERPQGSFSRQLFLGDTLDTDKLEADYDAGVLTIRLPVADHARPRRVEVSSNSQRQQINA
jgi:HSP20 family protein